MTQYSFTTSFDIASPHLTVWDTLLAFPGWKDWWPGVRKMAVSNQTTPPTLHISIGFPFYALKLELHIMEIEIGKKIQFKTTGDLIGDGSFFLHSKDHETTVIFDWNVRTPKRWMNIVALFAKPLFEFSHNLVMHWFVRGIGNKLDAKISHAKYIINPVG